VSPLIDESPHQCHHRWLRFDANPSASSPGGPQFSAYGFVAGCRASGQNLKSRGGAAMATVHFVSRLGEVPERSWISLRAHNTSGGKQLVPPDAPGGRTLVPSISLSDANNYLDEYGRTPSDLIAPDPSDQGVVKCLTELFTPSLLPLASPESTV
jgi:hypothetical protein